MSLSSCLSLYLSVSFECLNVSVALSLSLSNVLSPSIFQSLSACPYWSVLVCVGPGDYEIVIPHQTHTSVLLCSRDGRFKSSTGATPGPGAYTVSATLREICQLILINSAIYFFIADTQGTGRSCIKRNKYNT